ncbi:MAG: acetylxylan esterase [Verrucomicrobia bacterium]|nr:acetylxylan esterase [Verrucomicrobiota bacterium]
MGLTLAGLQHCVSGESDEGFPRAYFQAETRKLADGCLTRLGSAEEWSSQREARRRELLEMLGIWPLPERGDLRARVTGRLDQGDFEVERLHFQSSPGLYVTANLYLPKGLKEPAPAILYVCGHGAAIQDGVSYGNKVSYHHHGVWFARQGYVCLMIDTLQLGEIQGLHHGTHRLGAWWWNSRGYTPAGVETWNGIRALDYLETRPEVDATRIGMTGRSGGGAYTWFVSAVDERVRVSAPVAGITDLENHVIDGTVSGHCDCMFMVNTYRWDYPQLAAMVAPRPLLIANSDKDSIFPLEGVLRVHRKVRGVYDLVGASTNLGLLITEGPHKDTQDLQVPVFRWFNRFLKSDESPIERAAVKVLTSEQLKVFEALPTDEINTRIQEGFVPIAKVPAVPGSAAEWRTQREEWLRSLRERTFGGWPEVVGGVESRRTLEVVRQGVRLEAYTFQSQPGVELTLLVARRSRLKQPRELEYNVLGEQEWIEWMRGMGPVFGEDLQVLPGWEAQGTAAETGAGSGPEPGWFNRLRERLTGESTAVAWLAPRGIGPVAWSVTDREFIQIRRRFMLLGQTLDGMRVWDIRWGMAALRELRAFRESAIQLRGEGAMGVNLLLAGVLEPGWERLELVGLPSTFRDGPDYMNILRFIELPQAVAMAAEHGRVNLTGAMAGDWGFVNAVGAVLNWEPERVRIQIK